MIWINVKVDIHSYEEVMKVIEGGTSLRSTSSTKMNLQSSRSHMIVTLHLLRTNSDFHSKLTLVDLAGSECLKQSEATGVGMKEAKNINLSLFELTNVLRDLNTPNKPIIYRNSKLTMLLKVKFIMEI